jgi:hypothetical protein
MPTLAVTAMSAGALVLAQSVSAGFEGFWGSKYEPSTAAAPAIAAVESASPLTATDLARAGRLGRPDPHDARARLIHWNQIAIDASGVDHTPVAEGESRVFGEQLGPGRASRAIAIVHIALFDAVNAIYGRWKSYTGVDDAPFGASVDAAIAQAAHDTLVAMFPSQSTAFDDALQEDLERIGPRGKEEGRRVGTRAAAAILARREHDGSPHTDPRIGVEFIPLEDPGKWRQDPVSQIPIALGASWGEVEPFVIASGRQFRVGPPPAMTSRAYTAAFNEVKRLGGVTSTERTAEQTAIGIYWAYDGTPSLCAPPRLYNQIIVTIANRMRTDFLGLVRLLAIANAAMADAGIAIWESKYVYQVWRPVIGIREADPGTGPTMLGDGNPATIGDPIFSPLGAPASNLSGPDFTPPFPAYPSGHAGFGGALFEVLRQFYGRDDISFTFVSDEFNGVTEGRPLLPRTFASLSQAEEENGQSRIYLGIHWSFDKTQGILQGRRVARYIMRNAFGPRR